MTRHQLLPAAHSSRHPRGESDRGSISLFAVVIAVALLVAIGFVVDGGGAIAAQQRAQSAAREAARTGGQQLNAAPAIRGIAATVDTGQAVRAAQTYLSADQVAGTVTSRGGTTVVVDTRTTYDPLFLSIIGIGPLTVTGHSEARVVRAVNGVEQ